MTMAAADAFLRDDLTRSGAHGVRLETEDGGHIREHTVWNVVRERLGIHVFRLGDRERAQVLIPELPRL
ncbi:MAG: hypothetical protein WB677_14785 [Xanthobacteraceae bacterium]